VRRRGLEALAGLKRVVLEEAVAAEVEVASMVLALAMDEGKADGERATALLGVFVMGLRNADAMVDVLAKFNSEAGGQITTEVYDGRVQGRDGAAMYVNSVACMSLGFDIALKYGAAVRGPLEKAALALMGAFVKASCPKPRYQELLPLFLEAAASDDAVMASAACMSMAWPLYGKTSKACAGTYLSCDPATVCWGVRGRLVETGLPARQWRPLVQVLSVESVCVSTVSLALQNVPIYALAVPHDGIWPDIIAEVVHMCNVNLEAKLSAQDRFSWGSICCAFLIADRAARDPAHHPALLPCAEALLWTSANGFAFVGADIADYAAMTCVSLLGRNEGGLTLDKGTVDCVLKNVHRYFDTSPTADWRSKNSVRKSASHAAPQVRLVADMVIADANKPLVLAHPHALDDLVIALLLNEDNPRRGQDGADKLQETAALALENLALSEAGKGPLRAHTGVMAGLRALKSDAMSDVARRSASVALFELDEETRQKAKEAAVAAKAAIAQASGADSGGSAEVEHVMLSYNWGHQDVIKRLNTALKARSYNVWIDIEKMQGSTVEAMSEAVEECAVMCYGISQAYKESTNCRMEAQYAHQQQKDMVPLMMEDGYRAKGWLGMLLGVRLWYGFYGATLESDEAFEGKVEELCRELGERGKER